MKTTSSQRMISVIIPIYKPNEEYLREALKSVINQDYASYEVLLIVDGDHKSTEKVLTELNDGRFRILINENGKGLSYSLNRGFEESKGDYVLRMDADDICMPNRFRTEVNYLNEHADIDMVGSYAKTFGKYEKTYKSYTSYKDINAELIFRNPIVHPTVMFRKAAIDKFTLRYADGESEDYRLWIEMAFKYRCRMEVIPEILLKYRMHEGQATVKKKQDINDMDRNIFRYKMLILELEEDDDIKDIIFKINLTDRIDLHSTLKALRIERNLERCLPNNVSRGTFRKLYYKSVLKKSLRR